MSSSIEYISGQFGTVRTIVELLLESSERAAVKCEQI
jgi:hypothetical protein